jgi:endo-1,4-beta-D-glucanase Y
MKFHFEKMEDYNAAADSLAVGSVVRIITTDEEFVVGADLSPTKSTDTVQTFSADSADLDKTGFFIAPLNTGNTLVVSSTNTVISKCNQAAILCTNPAAKGVGLFHAFVDSYGSTVTPTEANLDTAAQTDGMLNVDIVLLGDAGPHYPYAGVVLDFTKTSAGALPANKATFDVSAYTGVKITYKSTTAFKLQLEGNPDNDGANWFFAMPSTAGVDSTITILWSQFAQPGWVSGGQVRVKPLAALTALKFQYDTMQSSCSFTLKNIEFVGTGPFITAPTALPESYDAVTAKLVKKWFDNFYIESPDGKQGRAKWISGTNVDPEITVSEGIGYGMLVALLGVRSESANDPYRKKLDKMWAFYQANVDNHGLMNWKTSGFGTNGSAAGTVGSGSAPDADMDVAKALLLAYEKFKDPGYLTAARGLMWKIWNYEVMHVTTTDGLKYLLAPGDSWTSYCNPSYAAKLPAMRMFAMYDDNATHNWTQAYADNIWQLQQNQISSGAAGLQLPSNWCDYNGVPVAGSSTTGYGWDACRVPIHMSEAYRWFGDVDAYNYLKNIATDPVLLNAMLTAPMSIQLTVSPTGVFAQKYTTSWGAAGLDEYSTVGLSSILCAFTATAALSPAVTASIIDTIVNYEPDDADYFRLAVKCFVLAEVCGCAVRYGPDAGSASQMAQFINIVGPDNGKAQRAQIAFPLSGGAPQYRLYTNGTWSEFAAMGGSGGGGGSSTGPVILTATADFGVDGHDALVVFPDTGATANDIGTVHLESEDLVLQGVIGHKIATAVGVSHTVRLSAPSGANGTYQIKLAITRG